MGQHVLSALAITTASSKEGDGKVHVQLSQEERLPVPLRCCLEAQSLTSSKETLSVLDYLLVGIAHAASSSSTIDMPSSPLTLQGDTYTHTRSLGHLHEELTDII